MDEIEICSAQCIHEFMNWGGGGGGGDIVTTGQRSVEVLSFKTKNFPNAL